MPAISLESWRELNDQQEQCTVFIVYDASPILIYLKSHATCSGYLIGSELQILNFYWPLTRSYGTFENKTVETVQS